MLSSLALPKYKKHKIEELSIGVPGFSLYRRLITGVIDFGIDIIDIFLLVRLYHFFNNALRQWWKIQEKVQIELLSSVISFYPI